jgi:hypothetical protein
VARLQEAIYLSVKYPGDEGERLISITELPKSSKSLDNLKPLDDTRLKLAELELRCHPLLKKVVAHYRVALDAWMGADIDAYATNLRAARDQQKEITLLREKAADFLDWFTVNYELDIDQADYPAYARRVEDLENARKEFRQQQLHQVKGDTFFHSF